MWIVRHLCAAVAHLPPPSSPKCTRVRASDALTRCFQSRTEKEKDWPCSAARSERRLSAADSSPRPAAAVNAKRSSSSSKRSGHPCRHGIFHGRSSRSAAAAEERVLFWQPLGDRFDPAPLLLCHVMAELSSGLPSAKGNMLRARAASQVQIFFLDRRRKEEGKLRAEGAEGRSVLEGDQLPLPVSCGDQRSFSPRERAQQELSRQRSSWKRYQFTSVTVAHCRSV